MKTGRKTLSILLALMLVLCLTVTAFADDTTYTIQVQNATKDNTYSAYKVFDYDVQTSSYTISASSPFFTGVFYKDNTWQIAGLTFTPDDESNPTKYTVTFDANVFDEQAAADLAATLSKNTTGATAVKSEKATSDTVTLNVSDSTDGGAGYYLVTSVDGNSTASYVLYLKTVAGVSVIFEKSEAPTIDKDVKLKSGTGYADDQSEKEAYDIIDTIEYRLTVNTGSGTLNEDITITDTLPSGLAYEIAEGQNVPTITITSGSDTWTVTTDYTVSLASKVMTITLKSSKLSNLSSNTDIIITYSAKFDTSNTSTVKADEEYQNKAVLKYKEIEAHDESTVITYDIGGDKKFTKVDGTDKKALEGVTFVLQNSDGKYAEIKGSSSSGYTLTGWSTDTVALSDDNTSGDNNKYGLTTNSSGTFNLTGLGTGTYTLSEYKALKDYNKLEEEIDIVVTADGVTYKLSNDTDYENSITVENNKGTVLPSTGGIGTTIFYVVGGLMVFGAAVLLITKKRMSAYEE